MTELEKQVQEVNGIVRKIKVKNDILSKMPYDDKKIQQEINKDKQFLENQIRRMNKIIRNIQSTYLDPMSKNKIEQLKAQARKQIKRNEYLIKKLVKDNTELLQNQYTNSIEMVVTPKVQVYDEDYKLKLAHAEEKSKMIKQFSRSIVQISDIINQTNEMTLQQGQYLDLVEDNIQTTYDNVVAAKNNTVEASNYQKKSKKWIFVLAGVVILIALIITVVLITTR